MNFDVEYEKIESNSNQEINKIWKLRAESKKEDYSNLNDLVNQLMELRDEMYKAIEVISIKGKDDLLPIYKELFHIPENQNPRDYLWNLIGKADRKVGEIKILQKM